MLTGFESGKSRVSFVMFTKKHENIENIPVQNHWRSAWLSVGRDSRVKPMGRPMCKQLIKQCRRRWFSLPRIFRRGIPRTAVLQCTRKRTNSARLPGCRPTNQILLSTERLKYLVLIYEEAILTCVCLNSQFIHWYNILTCTVVHHPTHNKCKQLSHSCIVIVMVMVISIV